MIKQLTVLCFLVLNILLSGCQAMTPNNEENMNIEVNKQESLQGNITNQSDYVADDSNIEDGAQVKVNLSIRQLTSRKVKILVDGHTFTMSLYDNKTADDFWNQLPLSITANNYNGWEEKICPLGNKNLSMEDAPKGDCPLIPEVGYYQPGNWIALYYGEIGYWSGKVPLGTIDTSLKELKSITDDSSIIFEKIDE